MHPADRLEYFGKDGVLPAAILPQHRPQCQSVGPHMGAATIDGGSCCLGCERCCKLPEQIAPGQRFLVARWLGER